jgi:hypothetical protein
MSDDKSLEEINDILESEGLNSSGSASKQTKKTNTKIKPENCDNKNQKLFDKKISEDIASESDIESDIETMAAKQYMIGSLEVANSVRIT